MAGGDLAGGKRTAADLGAWLVFEDESGQGLRPPKGRTWGRRGRTPVVKVTGGHNTRVSLAALIATRPGHQTRLIYRTRTGRRHGHDQRKGFTETDYARFLDAAHQQPMMVISAGEPFPETPGVLLARWAWRYRSELAPAGMAAALVAAAWWLHHTRPHWWPVLAVLTGVATWAVALFGAR